MRNMSFSLTTPQVRARTKTVTRRLGWEFVEPGDVVMACEKCQGIAKGALVRLGPIRVVNKRREPLNAITIEDVEREGFPGMGTDKFVDMFCSHMKCEPGRVITRIEFEYVD